MDILSLNFIVEKGNCQTLMKPLAKNGALLFYHNRYVLHKGRGREEVFMSQI